MRPSSNLNLTALVTNRKKSFPMMALGSLDAAVDAFGTSTTTTELPLNVTNSTSVDDMDFEDPGESARYKVVVPILMGCCLVTFLMNAVIVVAFPLIRSMSQV